MRSPMLVSFVVCIFLSGWVASNFYLIAQTTRDTESPFSFRSLFLGTAPELYSPGDHIPEEDIHVYRDQVIIDLPGALWAKYADTNSMDPVFDSTANGLEVTPQTPADITVGDVISYETALTEGLVVHRVVATRYDNRGWYALVRGDNNPAADPQKVRFESVHGILVGILY